MSNQELDAMLAKPNNMIVATRRPKGGPQLSPVWYYWDGDYFYFSTTRGRAKYNNIKRDPEISVIVDDPESQQYIAAYGRAHIIEDNFKDIADKLISKYVPQEELNQWEKEFLEPDRVIVQLHPEKILSM